MNLFFKIKELVYLICIILLKPSMIIIIQNKRRSNWEYGESFATYLTEGRIPFASILTFDDLEKYNNISAYYTDDSIKKIEKLSNSEFLNELDNLHLMCQLN